MEENSSTQILAEFEYIINNGFISQGKKNLIDYTKLLKDILNSIDDVIFILNEKYEILWVNSACTPLYGYTPNELKKFGYNKIIKLIHPDDLNILTRRIKLFTKGLGYESVIRIKHKNGHYVCVKNTGKVFKRMPDGTPCLFLFVSTDISNIIKPDEKINYLININDKLNDCKITKREYEILKMIAEGYAGKQIAYRLNISFNTVRTHRSNLM